MKVSERRQLVEVRYERPEFDSVLEAFKHRRHFTLLQGWRRYADAAGTGKKKYGYAQYCALFAEWARTNDLVAVLRHEPGRAMHVDWAGDTLDVVDRADGVVVKVYLFVAVLPYSGVIFCRAYADMKSEAWLDAHVRAFAFYGGVPQLVVPDNPTTSTHQRHKGDSERVVNARYQQLADHYETAIVPARAKKPRDKAAAEAAVNVVNLRVIGYLEGEVWYLPACRHGHQAGSGRPNPNPNTEYRTRRLPARTRHYPLAQGLMNMPTSTQTIRT